MSTQGQSLISSLSNISNCSGHQCNCCADLQSQITNLQAQIHLINERFGAVETLLDNTATKAEHLQEQIDLLVLVDLAAALFALVLPEILAVAGPAVAGIVGNVVPVAIAAALTGAIKEITEAVGLGSEEIAALSRSAKSDVEGVGSAAKSEVEGVGSAARSGVESVANSTKSEVESLASSTKNEIESIANSARSEVESAASSAKSEVQSVADSARSEVESAASSAKTEVKGLADSEKSEIEGLGSSVKDDVKGLADSEKSEIEGLGNSVKDDLKGVADSARTELNGVANTARTELEVSENLAKTQLLTVANAAENEIANAIYKLGGLALGEEIQLNLLKGDIEKLQNEQEQNKDKPVKTSTISVQVFDYCDTNHEPVFATRTVSVIEGTEEAEALKFKQISIDAASGCKIGYGDGLSNLLNEVREIGAIIVNASEQTINTVATGFNALQDDGILSEGNWKYYPTNISLKAGTLSNPVDAATVINNENPKTAVALSEQITTELTNLDTNIQTTITNASIQRNNEIQQLTTPNFSWEDLA